MKLQINLDKNKKYLLACSFGPDSMCLFHLLKEGGYTFEVAHVNYGLREEAKDETRRLVQYCENQNIIIHVFHAEVKKDKNIEDECRKIRYSFFRELFRQNGYDYVLIAHNQDDLLETYIMQKQRNMYPNYYGIAENIEIFDINIIRPLLNFKKSDLETYCINNNVPYSIDSSNLTNIYLRNRIRHNIIAKMSDKDRLNMIEEIRLMNLQREHLLSNIQKVDLTNVNNLLSFNQEEFILAINLLTKRLDQGISISAKCCYEIRQILVSDKPNILFKINKNVSFVKEYDKCKIVSNKKEVTYSFIVEKPDLVDNEFFHFDLSKDLKKRNLTFNDFPITVRTYQKGDMATVKDYMVSVRRMFIDFKMPVSTRKYWPIIVDKYGTIKYIPRYRANFDINSSPDFYVKMHE